MFQMVDPILYNTYLIQRFRFHEVCQVESKITERKSRHRLLLSLLDLCSSALGSYSFWPTTFSHFVRNSVVNSKSIKGHKSVGQSIKHREALLDKTTTNGMGPHMILVHQSHLRKRCPGINDTAVSY